LVCAKVTNAKSCVDTGVLRALANALRAAQRGFRPRRWLACGGPPFPLQTSGRELSAPK